MREHFLVRWFLDTQLYSYLANGTIGTRPWRRVLARRELWLSPVTAYELLEGLLNASAHTYPLSLAAVEEAAKIPALRTLPADFCARAAVRGWLTAAGRGELPKSFFQFRERITEGREKFLAQVQGFMARVMPHYRRLGDPLFSEEWQAAAGRTPGEHLDAAFVFQTSVLERAMRIRYNPEKHPSDYLDYLQLGFLRQEDVSFITADRKLARVTSRSLESDRIYLWEELA